MSRLTLHRVDRGQFRLATAAVGGGGRHNALQTAAGAPDGFEIQPAAMTPACRDPAIAVRQPAAAGPSPSQVLLQAAGHGVLWMALLTGCIAAPHACGLLLTPLLGLQWAHLHTNMLRRRPDAEAATLPIG